MVALANYSMPAHHVASAVGAARFEASRRIRLGHFSAADREDLVQDLLVGVVAKWPRFDSTRSKFSTYFSVVVQREAASFARARRAAKRGGGRTALSLDERLASCESSQAMGGAENNLARCELRNDVRSVVDRLPPGLRCFAKALMTQSPTAAAQSLKLSKRTAAAHMRELREQFEAAGLRP